MINISLSTTLGWVKPEAPEALVRMAAIEATLQCAPVEQLVAEREDIAFAVANHYFGQALCERMFVLYNAASSEDARLRADFWRRMAPMVTSVLVA